MFLANILGFLSPKSALFPIKVVIVAYVNATKVMQDTHGPLPSYHGLNAIPKLVFNKFTSFKKVEEALLGHRDQSNVCVPFVGCHHLMPNKPHKWGLLY